MGLSEHRALYEKARDLTGNPSGGISERGSKEGEGYSRARYSSAPTLFAISGRGELHVSMNIGDSKFRYDLDGVRFVEASDESHTKI